MSEPQPPRRIVKRTGRPVVDPSADLDHVCFRHGPSPHRYYSRGNGKLRLRCKRCVSDAVTRRHQLIKQTLVAEAGGCCVLCGYARSINNLHFHHVDPAAKVFSMSTGAGKALDTYRLEAAKCVLVCANCHGEIEAGLLASPPAGSTFQSLRN